MEAESWKPGASSPSPQPAFHSTLLKNFYKKNEPESTRVSTLLVVAIYKKSDFQNGTCQAKTGKRKTTHL